MILDDIVNTPIARKSKSHEIQQCVYDISVFSFGQIMKMEYVL